MLNRVTILLIVLPVTLFAVAFGGGASSTGPATAPCLKVPLTPFLMKFGTRFGIHFTVERDQRGAYEHQFSPLSTAELDEMRDLTSVEQVMSVMKAAIPGVLVERSANDPKVIHIIDGTLKKIDGYAMDRKVSVRMTGTPADLVRAIGSRLGGALIDQEGGGVNESIGDRATDITVNVVDVSARDALTIPIPLKSYHAVVWIADVSKKGNEVEIAVRHNGKFKPE